MARFRKEKQKNMLLNTLIQIVVATDCFKFNTSISYSAQRYNLHFYATPSKQLIGEEKRLCEDVIHDQQYELQVFIGAIKFSKTGLKYDKDNDIIVTAQCAGNASDCEVSKVQKIQTATYKLIFHDIDLELTSIVNYFQIRTYNHLSCIRTANLIYDGVQKNFEIDIVDPVLNCPCSWYNPTTTPTPPGKLKNNIQLISKLDGVPLVTRQYNKNNMSSIMKFYDATSGTNIGKNPSSSDKFWQEIRTFGPYNQKNFLLIGTLLNVIRTTPILKIAMRLQLLTEVKQVRDNTAGTPTKDFYYFESLEYTIQRLTNKNQPQCFDGVAVELHKLFFYVGTFDTHNPQNCSRSFIEGLTQKPYDSIRLQIIASQNTDRSGFNYHIEHELTNFDLGQDIRRRFYCKDEDDCKQLQKLADIHRHYLNTSVAVKLLFMSGEEITFSAQYVAQFSVSPFGRSNVSLLNNLICIEILPQKDSSEVLELEFFDYNFQYTQFLTTKHRVYCNDLTTEQKQNVFKIITKMKGNVDITHRTSLKTGNSIIGDINVVVYQVPKGNSLVWICVAPISVLGIVGSIGTFLFFRKQVDVWNTGHVIANIQG